MSVGPRDLHPLHSYFLWADRMRLHFYQTLPPQGADCGTTAAAMFHQPYMSYWYPGTYVLIEGWQELELSDETIDSLLGSPHVDTLRRYRNGAFHFAAFAMPALYEALEGRGVRYAIRLPANDVLDPP